MSRRRRSHSPPSKGRGRGGVCNILSMRKILTPPQPLPYKGGEWLRIDYSPFFFSCPDFLKWTQRERAGESSVRPSLAEITRQTAQEIREAYL